MKYLLDTHTYLWYRSSPKVLPAAVLGLLTDTSHEMLISIATPWEIAIKTGVGKLSAAGLLMDFESRETAAGFVFAGITTSQAIRSEFVTFLILSYFLAHKSFVFSIFFCEKTKKS